MYSVEELFFRSEVCGGKSLRMFLSRTKIKFTLKQKSVSHTFFFFYREDGKVKFLTKGDNNSVDDRGLYAPGQLWLEKKDVVGRARG